MLLDFLEVVFFILVTLVEWSIDFLFMLALVVGPVLLILSAFNLLRLMTGLC